jgi:hypothetical protein
MSQLYFNNNQKDTVDLKKAEILIYYDEFIVPPAKNVQAVEGSYSFMPKNFPFETTTTTPNNEKSTSKKFNEPLTLNKISKTFYPISMTIWGKMYDDNTNTFRMVEMNDNTNNITTFTVNNDNTISLSINLVTNTTGLGVTTDKNVLSKAVETGKTNKNPPLISKIIILYDDQNSQSIINSTTTKEPYSDMYNKMYIGIM